MPGCCVNVQTVAKWPALFWHLRGNSAMHYQGACPLWRMTLNGIYSGSYRADSRPKRCVLSSCAQPYKSPIIEQLQGMRAIRGAIWRRSCNLTTKPIDRFGPAKASDWPSTTGDGESEVQRLVSSSRFFLELCAVAGSEWSRGQHQSEHGRTQKENSQRYRKSTCEAAHAHSGAQPRPAFALCLHAFLSLRYSSAPSLL
jgi:hypothetical protein